MDASCSSGTSASASVNKLINHIQKNPPHIFHPSQQGKSQLDVSLNPQEAEFFERVFEEQKLKQALPVVPHDLNGAWGDEFAHFQAPSYSHDEMLELERKFEQLSSNDWQQEFDKFELQDQQLEDAFKEFEEIANFNETPASLTGQESSNPDLASDWINEFQMERNRVPSGEYPFEPNNPYVSHADPLQLARKLEADGNLSEAILAYESHLQRNALDSDPWASLGQLQAENEKEVPAILALQHALTVDPKHLPALLTLSVSYTNEGYDDEAYKLLYRWATGKFNVPNVLDVDVAPSYEIYNHITDLLLEQIRLAPEIDAETQIALGLVFYNAGQHDKSIDCFKTALSVRPDDYTLWNRVGATLANSGQSEQAIDAYFKALEIKPSYVRARYNLGVSCMNIGCFKDAAEHFLSALSICGGTRNVADNLWDTLRRCFILMERSDLVELARNGTDLKTFKKDFDF